MDNYIYTKFIFCSLSIRPCIHKLCIQVFEKEKKSYLISVLNTYLPFMIVFYYKANILPFFEKNIEFLYIVNAQKKKKQKQLKLQQCRVCICPILSKYRGEFELNRIQT